MGIPTSIDHKEKEHKRILMRFVWCALLATVLTTAVVLGQLDSEQPIVVGKNGFGYTFGIQHEKSLIVATNPVGNQRAAIIRTQVDTPGSRINQVYLAPNKGRVTCGCILKVEDKDYLFAGLSVGGMAIQVDLSGSANLTVKYLDTTSSTTSSLWGSNPAQTFISAVCIDKFVFFGTKSTSTATTVVRMEPNAEDFDKRFLSLGDFGARGDLTQGAVWWGDDVLFAMEPESTSPLTFYVVQKDSFKIKLSLTMSTPLPHFMSLSGLWANAALRQVIIANKNGEPWIAQLDLSHENTKTGALMQELSLATAGLSPASSLVVDSQAKYAYVTLGDCSSDDVSASIGLVAVRLVPEFNMTAPAIVDPSHFQCSSQGLPSYAVLIKRSDDTTLGGPRRRLFVLTQLDMSGEDASVHAGVVLPFTVYSAGQCGKEKCNEESNHGYCAGLSCYCRPAWHGASCSEPTPCGGSNCSGNGVCTSGGVCACNVGFVGDDCSLNVPCPSGCSLRGKCVKGSCECDTGFFGPGCESESVGCEALKNCSDHGTCNRGYPSGTCSCEPTHTGVDCSELKLECPSNCSGHGLCVQGVCKCVENWSGNDCNSIIATCPNNCSAHGLCKFERCFCFAGFKGRDCSVVDRDSCPNQCSGHGTCASNGECGCESGWKGIDCSHAQRELHVAAHAILVAGENKATTSFVVTSATADGPRNLVVVGTGGKPGKCIVFDGTTMSRVQEASFEPKTPASIGAANKAAAAEARARSSAFQALAQDALIPDANLLQLGATETVAPISVALVEDTVNGFAVIGTAIPSGAMHGQLFKISTTSFERLGMLQLTDDSGRGVTAGCRGPNGTFIIASGSNPAALYQISGQLDILNRVSPAQSPVEEISAVAFNGQSRLVAATASTLYIYSLISNPQSSTSSLDALAGTPTLQLPSSFGDLTAGFGDAASGSVYFGTSGSPAALVKVSFSAAQPSVETLRFKTNENRIGAAVSLEDYAYFGLGTNKEDGTCTVAVVSLSAFREVDSLTIVNCTSDLISASISPDGRYAYFGSAASPAHVYTVRLFSRDHCPRNCSSHGICVQGTCSCHTGWMGDFCNVAVPVCPNNCSQAGICNFDTLLCTCNTGHFGADCSVIEICADLCQHGTCTGAGSDWPCTCESEAWSGTHCSEQQPYCPNECSRRGSCSHGICKCNVGYTGEDCSVETFPPVSLRGCTADSDCGTHGACNIDKVGTGVCVCAPDWSGEDCDVDEKMRRDMQPKDAGGISIVVVILIVLGAALLGVVLGVSVWKSWAKSKRSGNDVRVDQMEGGVKGPSKIGAPPPTNYARLPRRLVK